jgi:hypothetical protein
MNFESLLTQKPSRWPKKGDSAFRKAMRIEAAAPLAHDGLTRTVSIMGGFMHAGRALADLALKDRIRRHDVIYPMLFCYRHAVETGLKWLITQYGPPVGVQPVDIDETHDLLCLWDHFARINQTCGANANDEALITVGKIVKPFHDWDKSSTKFRYATSKSGAATKFQHPHIDIENLRDVMDGVAHFLAGSDGWLDSRANAY